MTICTEASEVKCRALEIYGFFVLQKPSDPDLSSTPTQTTEKLTSMCIKLLNINIIFLFSDAYNDKRI